MHFSQELGSGNYWVLFVTRELAIVLRDRGQIAQAEALFRQTIPNWLDMKQYGNGSWDLWNLANLLLDDGRGVEAEDPLRNYIDIRTEVFGSDDSFKYRAMNLLAWILKDLGDSQLAEAESIAREARDGQSKLLGPEADATLTTADTLAVVLHMRRKNKEAIVEFEAIAAAKKTADDRWFMNCSALQYGQCLAALSRYEDAEAVFLAIRDDGDESAIEPLIDLYDAWGKPELADPFRAPSGVLGSD